MTTRGLPENPRASAPGRVIRSGWRWRAGLMLAALLLASVVVAQVIARLRESGTRAANVATHVQPPEGAHARPFGSLADGRVAAVAPLASPAPAPTPAATHVRLAGAATPAPPVRRSSDSLAWTYTELPCEAGAPRAPGLLARSASVARRIVHCVPSRILALVDAKPRARATPAPAAFSAQALASSMAPHPRLILDSATLTALRQRATSANPQWVALKARCDSYIGGQVQYPSGNAYPDLPNLGQGYQGSDYVPALLAEGMCYQVLRTSSATAAATYGAKAVDILMKMSASGSQG